MSQGRKWTASGHRVGALRKPSPKRCRYCSAFAGSCQAYWPYDPQVEEHRPSGCSHCGDLAGRPRGHGCYWRQVWDGSGLPWIGVRRFLCVRCGLTISLLPSFAVPFKRYGADVVESCLEAVVGGHGGSVGGWVSASLQACVSTAAVWVEQFRAGSGLLLTLGAERLTGSPAEVGADPERPVCEGCRAWGFLRGLSSSGRVLREVQPRLCLPVPGVGVFHLRL